MERIISLFITMTMMITPTVKPSTPTLEPTVEPTAATVEPTVEPSTPTVAPTDEPSTIPIAYDDTAEREAHYIRKFKITDISKTNGSYVITYTLETFLEGRGTVSVAFNCYDADGRVVDTFGDGFVGTDYTWSAHERTATISDKTVRIGLSLN